MITSFEVNLDSCPGEGEPTPTADDIASAIRTGLAQQGFFTVEVTATRLTPVSASAAAAERHRYRIADSAPQRPLPRLTSGRVGLRH